MKKTVTLSIIIILSQFLYAQIDITTALMAYYPFNGNANDSSGNGNHGTEKGVSLVNDRDSNSNSAYFFDGNDKYIEVPAHSSIQPQNAITVSAWVNTTDKNWWNFAVCKRLNLAMEPGNSYLLGTTGAVPGGATWQWSISSATTQNYVVSATLVEENKWLHLAGTFDGDTSRLYLNGQIIGTKVYPNTTISYSNLTLKLGLAIPTSSGNKTSWKGYMDEVRIYNRALSAEDIKYLYNPITTGVDEITPHTITIDIYPNPTEDRLYISAPYALDKLSDAPVIITDILGKTVLSTINNDKGLDISALSPGTYFISVEGFGAPRRFIKN